MKTDSEIQKDVLDELRWSPALNTTEIGVAVRNGVVTLSGTVDSYFKKTIAENVTKKVAGVKAVAEDIIVKYNDSLLKNDSEIAQAVVNALKWHSAINEEKIKIKVENGVVTLEGETDWEFQRRSAIEEVQNLAGVKSIVNKITIKTGVVPKELKDKIASAFQRNATLDSEKISIKVNGNTVTLTGKVRSLAEKNDAENAVWAAPGVTKVENNLVIDAEVFAF